MKKFFLLGIAVLGLVLITGCVTPINVGQVLQLPEGAKLYTTYNIWYEIPWNISSINYHRGKIIPFGSEVKIISMTPRNIKFQVLQTGRQYTIVYYEKWGMQPIEDFIKQLVTEKTRSEQTKGIAAEVKQAILRGDVQKGMTRKEVTMAYGAPSPHRTPLLEGSTWIYWKNRYTTQRIIFKNNKVIDILD
jgi:hypothetical protein